MAINPTDAQMAAFQAAGMDTPIHMLNLLKFRDNAFYRDHPDEPARTGREAYAVYGKTAFKCVQSVGGKQIWSGKPEAMMIGEGAAWDLAIVVEYPNAGAMLQMISSPEYQACHYHRLAAMEDMKLIRCEPQ